ncbi:thioesterase II family protein [Streptomyces sp. NPDC059917]|uniref:thioesterase II family protein n=1 Tax=Streptomyces sp. NPDC059917 TaxID=3347002 RepID=UPI00364D7D23
MSIPDTQRESWIRRFHPAPDAPVRLLCLPHAGGTASYFFPFSQRLAAHGDAGADVLSVQYPGRQDRRLEPALEDVTALVDGIHDALAPWNDLPLVLFGHSMGAVLAFELARRLEREGKPPLGLIVSGRRSPDILRTDHVHTLGDHALVEEVRLLSGTDPGVLDDEEILRMVLPALRADFKAIETYRYRAEGTGPALRCPLSVLTGTSDPRVTPEQAVAWRELTGGRFTFRAFPGGHFYLAHQQAEVTAAVVEDLAAFASHAASAPATGARERVSARS